jgi:DNA-binding IclR family transcriptional regulator
MSATVELVVTADAGGVRRSLGPIAWVVLEELASTSSRRTEVVSTNVRDLAEALGLNKDTVSRALNRLIGAGMLVRRHQPVVAGRFGPGSYQLRLPPGLRVETEEPPRRTPATPPQPTRTTSQLSLIDID